MIVNNHPEVSPERQLELFMEALFFPEDLVEIRGIESWQKAGKRESRLVYREWMEARHLVSWRQKLAELNEAGSNIYFGVNPRSDRSGTKGSVQFCRCLWTDFDGMELYEASKRVAVLPRASVAVDSGHGIHFYWLLDEPVRVGTMAERSGFERMLGRICQEVGADRTHDVARILRLPGFWNVKNRRNGEVPVGCHLLWADKSQAYGRSCFSKWMHQGEEEGAASEAPVKLPGFRNEKRIRGLLRHLEKDVRDRSKRDFSVVCGLLRLGVSPEEVIGLVGEKSKFLGNKEYLEITIFKACRAVGSLWQGLGE